MDEPTPATGAEGIQAEAVLRRVAPHVDAGFYRAQSPEAAAGEDAAAHFCRAGWRDGRDPNAWFSTTYYLHANPDVRQSGVNPFWHFLVQGVREGRRARAAGAVWREAFERATAPPRPAGPAASAPAAAPALGPDELRRLVGAACGGARGLVVSVSHDRYIEVPGGTQLLIADEQRKFNGDRAVYLHLSPLVPGAGLAPDAPAPFWCNVILDGAVRGIATVGSLALALASLAAGPAATYPRLLVVHALHGHRPEAVAEIAAALRPRHAFFWVHDFGAACPSPRLLRNDIAFCHGPPPDSFACRVCMHGPGRRAHLARIRALFAAVPFHVVAPSRSALELFRRATDLPVRSARVHPHARLTSVGAPAAVAEDGPVRAAFVGHAEFHKGWTRFRELVSSLGGSSGVAFHHFASPSELRALDGVTLVAAASSAARPFGMARALAEHRIDLVLALSPWPETFGYVAHEALAAGADLLAVEGSGHVAELARATDGSLVLADDAAMAAFFRDGAAAAHVRARRDAGRQPFALTHDGSTATIGFDASVPPTTDAPDLHLLLRGARLDGRASGGTWRFALPADGDGKRTVRLRSRSLRGAWDRADEGERRRLGVAVAAIALDGAPVPPGDPRRVSGWHAPDAGWQWTDGDAALLVGPARRLDVTLLPLARYWRAPLLDEREAPG
jgi:glycosyltransferase involved in cell wall biosynthesis